MRPTIFVVSDSIGETAELVARAAASQFDAAQADYVRVPHVDSRERLDAVAREARQRPSVIVYTLVLPEFREHLRRLAEEMGIPHVDIMGPMLRALERVIPTRPKLQPGLVRQMDEEYFRRIEAVEFAVKHDDGKDPRGLLEADIVLIGVSRTSKTPVSLYLAQRCHRVANLPLVPELRPPPELFRVPRERIVGLTVDPDQLQRIREARLKVIGLTRGANYADRDRILRELEYAQSIFQKLGCPVVDVTNRAVEETASCVLELVMKREGLRSG